MVDGDRDDGGNEETDADAEQKLTRGRGRDAERVLPRVVVVFADEGLVKKIDLIGVETEPSERAGGGWG